MLDKQSKFDPSCYPLWFRILKQPQVAEAERIAAKLMPAKHTAKEGKLIKQFCRQTIFALS